MGTGELIKLWGIAIVSLLIGFLLSFSACGVPNEKIDSRGCPCECPSESPTPEQDEVPV